MRHLGRITLVSMLVLNVLSASAQAQAPVNSNVALQPSKGGLIIRQQFRYTQGEQTTPMGKLDVELTSSITTLVYGITDELTLIFDTPFILSRHLDNTTTGNEDDETGLSDQRVLSKLRIYRNDFGPNDTARFDLIGGLEIPTGKDEFSSDSVDPIFGGVFTHIQGRHAFDADAIWKLNTGKGRHAIDQLKYDLAYIYRLSPETYASTKPTALFASLELNGLYETNNDQEIFLSPGLQYVTTRWILEATVQLPVWQQLDSRLEREIILGVGFRVQF